MKTVIVFVCLVFSVVAQQNIPVGRMALTPLDSAAVDGLLFSAENLNPQGGQSSMAFALDGSQTSVQLPSSIVANCTWTYPVTTLTVTGNVATATTETFPAYLVNGASASMPVGTRIAISNAVNPAFNQTFTVSALQTQNQLTFAVIQANGTYTNPSVDSNYFILLTYNRCAVLIDSEVLTIIGTSDGTNFTAVRGELGTVAAPHASGAAVTLLRYPDKRHWYRSIITQATGEAFSTGRAVTPRYTQLLQQISTAQAALAQATGRAAR